MKFLAPIIEERFKKIEEYGKDYPDKPVRCIRFTESVGPYESLSLKNDLLSWLMDEAEGEERTVKALTVRILTVNFAAIHTSSMVCARTQFVS